jgi:hypothetical protein
MSTSSQSTIPNVTMLSHKSEARAEIHLTATSVAWVISHLLCIELAHVADSATLTPQGPSQRQCLAHATKMLEQYLNSKAPPLMLQCQHVVLWHEWRIQGLPGHLYQTSLRSCRAHLTV